VLEKQFMAEQGNNEYENKYKTEHGRCKSVHGRTGYMKTNS